ncbi:hypothetical protein N431DRAFT_496544 [Stipitochalara longipes BDJ]|nr:hypothetical protein N431DRAFT_496544 [Stipitochalara longipes BDJ]
MSSLFCCSSIVPFKPRIIDKEAKFNGFINWARAEGTTSVTTLPNGSEYLSVNKESCFVIQLVCQVNYGPLESKRFFAKTAEMNAGFCEVLEQDLIESNYQKVNSFKNFKCVAHNKFFELNLYQKDPVNKHHWRANIARPATDIDLPSKVRGASPKHSTTVPSPLEVSHITHPPQIIETGSDMKSALTTDPTPSISKTSARYETGTERAHGEVEREKGIEHLTRDNLHGFRIGGLQTTSDGDSFGDYSGYDYDYMESSSRRSQSPEDFTACSADSCGYCGHCSY